MICAEATEDFLDMLGVVSRVLGEDENIVEVYNNTDVQHVLENVLS
jgi:hypothetical protein